MRVIEEISFVWGFVVELKLDEGVRGLVLFWRGVEYDIGDLVIDNVGLGGKLSVFGRGVIGNMGDSCVDKLIFVVFFNGC